MQEESGPPMPPPVGSNWEMFLDGQLGQKPPELDLKTLQPGDRLLVGTKNTRYEFEWRQGGSAELTTDRADRPWGLVNIAGCAFRGSGVLAPGILFHGGKLEYVSTSGKVRHRTTPISSLTVLRKTAPNRHPARVQLDAAG